MSAQPVHARDRRPLGVLVVAFVQFVRAVLVAAQLLGSAFLPDDSQLAGRIQREPTIELGQDLRPGAPGRANQEDPAEGLLVRSVARGQRLVENRIAGGAGGLLDLRQLRRRALAARLPPDPGMGRQGLVDLLGGQRRRGGARDLLELGQ